MERFDRRRVAVERRTMAMKGDPAIIRTLNAVLTNELTAVNQYFLHARMFESWGLKHLGQVIYDESIGEMKHADMLIKRILFLDGLPNLQDLHKLKIGEDVPEMFTCDLGVESHNRACLQEAIAYCEEVRDFQTREIFVKILDETEEHIDWLTHQLRLIDGVGRENYKQEQMFKGS